MHYKNRVLLISSSFIDRIKKYVLAAVILVCLSQLDASQNLPSETYTLRDIVINYHSRDERIIKELGSHILKDIDNFQKTISFYPEINTVINVAPDEAYYEALTAEFGGVIEFSEAFYSGSDKVIYIRNPRHLSDYSRLRTVILHEYIHLFIDSLFNNVPLWFHEGMAVFFSEGLSFDRELYFAKDFLLGNTLPLSQMTYTYPPNRIQWQSFYTKSALATKYLYSRHTEAFYDFWELSETKPNFQHAFLDAFAMTPAMFANGFDDQLSRRYKIEILLSFTGLIWAILPLILLIAWIKKKIYAYRIQKKWDREINNRKEI